MIETSNYEDILSILSSIQNNEEKDELVIKTLEAAAKISNADGYFLYKTTPENQIILDIVNIKSLHLNLSQTSCDKIHTPVDMANLKNKADKSTIEICAYSQEVINSTNIHNEQFIDTSFFKKFDLENDYNSVSVLAFPILDNNKDIISIIQFINAQKDSGKIVNFTKAEQEKIIATCQLISVLLEKQKTQNLYNEFLEGFISVLSKITASKTPSFTSYNKQVSFISQRLARAIISYYKNIYPDFEMTDTQWNILNLTSWLYDCGKAMIPDYILNKKSRLETAYNRIHEIRHRFEILRRDAHIEYLKKRLSNTADKQTLQAEFVEKVKKLHDDFEFIGKCNCSDSLTKEDFLRIDKIAEQTFTRYFDRSIGISADEQKLIDKKSSSSQEVEHVLQDRPEQILTPYNQGETSNLKTKYGRFNSSELKQIMEQKISSSDILSNIPLPHEYSDIHEIVASYTKTLKNLKSAPSDNSKTSVIAKILSLADIFIYLISNENSSKKGSSLSKTLKIMQKMKNEGKIDATLYDIFIKNDIYTDFAKEFLDTKQIDEINIEEII